MPTFSYVARNIEGQPTSGSITAHDERSVREQLRRNNLFITRLEVQGAASTTATTSTSIFQKKAKLYDLVVFSR